MSKTSRRNKERNKRRMNVFSERNKRRMNVLSKRNKKRKNVFYKKGTVKLLFVAYGSPACTKVQKRSCPGWTSS